MIVKVEKSFLRFGFMHCVAACFIVPPKILMECVCFLTYFYGKITLLLLIMLK